MALDPPTSGFSKRGGAYPGERALRFQVSHSLWVVGWHGFGCLSKQVKLTTQANELTQDIAGGAAIFLADPLIPLFGKKSALPAILVFNKICQKTTMTVRQNRTAICHIAMLVEQPSTAS